jgi:hypothetical protein
VCEAGKEASFYTQGRVFAVAHAVFSEDVAQRLGLIKRDGAGRPVTSDVHTEELGECTQALDFEYGAETCLKVREPSSIIASGMNVVHAEGNHGEDYPGAEGIDARVLYALLPLILDKPISQEHVELAGGLFQAVEVAFEVVNFGYTIRKAEGLANVHILLDWGIEERSADVKLT